MGDDRLAREQWDFTESLLGKSDYWMNRFRQYSLNGIMNQRPINASEVYHCLENIHDEYKLLLFA